MVEQEAVNFEVAGSSPAGGANLNYLSNKPAMLLIKAAQAGFLRFINESVQKALVF